MPSKHELNHSMIATAQAASSPDITNQFTLIGEQEVQHCIHHGGTIYHLSQEVIFSTFQEPPGLPTVHWFIVLLELPFT